MAAAASATAHTEANTATLSRLQTRHQRQQHADSARRQGPQRDHARHDPNCASGPRRGNAVDHGVQDVRRLAALEQRVRRQRDAMAQRRQREALDVVRRHEVAAVQQRRHAAPRTSAKRAAGAAAEGEARASRAWRARCARRSRRRARRRAGAPRSAECPTRRARSGTGVTSASGSSSPAWSRVVRITTATSSSARRIADLDLEQEAVELRFGSG